MSPSVVHLYLFLSLFFYYYEILLFIQLNFCVPVLLTQTCRHFKLTWIKIKHSFLFLTMASILTAASPKLLCILLYTFEWRITNFRFEFIINPALSFIIISNFFMILVISRKTKDVIVYNITLISLDKWVATQIDLRFIGFEHVLEQVLKSLGDCCPSMPAFILYINFIHS